MRTILIIGLGSLLATAACKGDTSDKPEAAKKVVDDEPLVDVDVNTERLEREKDEFVAKSRERIDALEKKMAELGDRATDDSEDARARLKEQWKAAKAELAEARKKSAAEWAEARENLSKSLDDLEAGYNRVLEAAKTDEAEK